MKNDVDATGGEAAELDEALFDLRVGADGPLLAEAGAGIAGDLVADIGAQQAISGGRAVVDVQAAAGAEAERVVAPG